MRRATRWILAAAATVVAAAIAGSVLASGFGPDAPPARIPHTAKQFSATVEDHGGTRVDVTQVSWNGEVFVYGNLGEAQVTLPFEKIVRVEFLPAAKEGWLTAKAKMRDGSDISIQVEDDTPCYGATTFGNYKIQALDIRRIDFPQ